MGTNNIIPIKLYLMVLGFIAFSNFVRLFVYIYDTYICK